MNTQAFSIEGIPALLWGDKADKLIIAVHGDQSHKADTIMALLAEEAVQKGYQVLSIDLPEHGDRKQEQTLCKVQTCVKELQDVLHYAQATWRHISLFGCSMGAYFGLMAYCDASIDQALFVSPVVNMQRLIENMMMWFDITPDALREQGEIPTPAKPLYWDYYQYVCSHPVRWHAKTAVLYGAGDTLCEKAYVESFSQKAQADLTIYEAGEHYFHTEEQLAFFKEWLKAKLL